MLRVTVPSSTRESTAFPVIQSNPCWILMSNECFFNTGKQKEGKETDLEK